MENYLFDLYSKKFCNNILKKNRFDLPIIIFGSNKKILQFKILPAIQIGKDIYPPVEITILILCFFIKKIDFKIDVKKKN